MTEFQTLVRECQDRYVGLRRKVQYFEMFGGAVIEALRERDYRLTDFDKHGDNLELCFEQRDLDEFRVVILPYRKDLPYLFQRGHLAQLKLELGRFCNDPETLREAIDVNTRASFGTMLGGPMMTTLDIHSAGSRLQEPGTMTFSVKGSRLYASTNVILDLDAYRISDFELNIAKVGADFKALFYGLEKYLHLLVKSLAPKE